MFRKKKDREEDKLVERLMISDTISTAAAKKSTNEYASIDLNKKVDEFVEWYYKNVVKDNYNIYGAYLELCDMKNLIEKMAVWYELRYPSYEVNKILHCCGQEMKNINDVMFKNNSYINDLLDENSDIKDLDWDEFYNTHAFIESLPSEEKYYLSRFRYNDILWFDRAERTAHIHITNTGRVYESENVDILTNNAIDDSDLYDLKLEEVVKLFKDRQVLLPENNEIEKEIEKANNWKYQKQEMLNCVMYRIMERGGNRIGPRRAFLFAKEFGLDIQIPMKYAVDYSDPGLRLFMNEYLKSGGSPYLICYVGYYRNKVNSKEEVKTTTVKELIKTLNNNASTFYTPEEDELHQKLVNILNSQIDQNELKIHEDAIEKEKVKQLRIERRLEKSRTSKN